MKLDLEDISLGEYETVVTAKNRLVIPQPLRTGLNLNAVDLYLQLEPAGFVSGYTARQYQSLLVEIQGISSLHQDSQEFSRAIFSQTQIFTLDEQGRITLPEAFLTHLKITEKSTVIALGVGIKFELWNKDLWQAKKSRFTNIRESLQERVAFLIDNRRRPSN